MLGVRLICVGKLGEKFWAQAVKEYEKRLSGYCKLEIIELPEQRLPQTPSEGEITQALDREAALIESKIWPGAAVIAMCVEGKPVRENQAEGRAAAVHVAHDLPASPRPRDGARAGLSRTQYRRRRQVSQVIGGI